MKEDLYFALEECQCTGELVGFYPWTDFEALLVGKVSSLDKVGVEFDLVHPGGTFDERKRYLIFEIRSIERGGAYLEGLTYLFDNRDALNLTESRGKTYRSPSRILTALRAAQDEQSPVCLRRRGDQSKLNCRIVSIDEPWIEVQEIRDGGVLDAHNLFGIDVITSIQVGGLSQQADAALLTFRAQLAKTTAART